MTDGYTMGSVRNSGIAVGLALLVAGAGPDSDPPVVNPRNCPSRLASDFINGVGRHDLARALNLRDRLFGDVHVEKAQNVGKAAEEKLPIKYAERWLLTADAVRGGKKDFAYDPNGLVPEVLRARALGLVPADDPRPQAWVRTSEYDEATGRMTHIHEKDGLLVTRESNVGEGDYFRVSGTPQAIVFGEPLTPVERQLTAALSRIDVVSFRLKTGKVLEVAEIIGKRPNGNLVACRRPCRKEGPHDTIEFRVDDLDLTPTKPTKFPAMSYSSGNLGLLDAIGTQRQYLQALDPTVDLPQKVTFELRSGKFKTGTPIEAQGPDLVIRDEQGNLVLVRRTEVRLIVPGKAQPDWMSLGIWFEVGNDHKFHTVQVVGFTDQGEPLVRVRGIPFEVAPVSRWIKNAEIRSHRESPGRFHEPIEALAEEFEFTPIERRALRFLVQHLDAHGKQKENLYYHDVLLIEHLYRTMMSAGSTPQKAWGVAHAFERSLFNREFLRRKGAQQFFDDSIANPGLPYAARKEDALFPPLAMYGPRHKIALVVKGIRYEGSLIVHQADSVTFRLDTGDEVFRRSEIDVPKTEYLGLNPQE